MGNEITARILIVDDNIAIHNDFKKVLAQDKIFGENEFKSLERELFADESSDSEDDVDTPIYEVDSAFQGQEALHMVEKAEQDGEPYALVFMDVRMPPGWDGIKTISKIWERHSDIEMVICTAYSDYSWEKIIQELGTTDRLLFLRKPFDTTAVKQMALSLTRKWNLHRQARLYVSQLENEITERRRSEERLDYLAHHDVLTSLANRTQFVSRLHEAIGDAQNKESGLAVFFIDLDRFKEINDTLGYMNGDLILQQMAHRLINLIGKRGSVARFGGDEFAIFLPGICTHDEAAREAQAMHDALEPLFDVDELQLEVRASIGIVLYPVHGEDADTLMRRADMTMSVAKTSDPGFTFYDPNFDHYSAKRLTLLGELRAAILQDDLRIHYQPKVEMKSHRVVGFEALIRWHHAKHGLLSPAEFVPLAERSGLIKPISLWVIKEVSKHWQEWDRSGLDLTVSVNLSARDLLDSDLPDKVIRIIEDGGMDPTKLILEITESAMMEDPEQAKQILSEFSRLGIKMSIDDFGTGYSSLAYLKKLPVDEMKIDQSFVFDMCTNSDDANIVKSTIDLGHTLNLRVAAEGVENEETWNKLSELGCDVAQGFWMGMPLPVEDVRDWLHTSRWGLTGERT
ncbi:MAG: EAL domain-containing protein [Acidobacteria bacterium]|nr:EAL domain-containing protein [Acidobacteriota bacterium]